MRNTHTKWAEQTKTQSESNQDHLGLQSTKPAPEDRWVVRSLPQCTMCQPQSACITDESPASKGGQIEVSPNVEWMRGTRHQNKCGCRGGWQLCRGFPRFTGVFPTLHWASEKERERERPLMWMKGRKLHECMCGLKNPLYAYVSLLRRDQERETERWTPSVDGRDEVAWMHVWLKEPSLRLSVGAWSAPVPRRVSHLIRGLSSLILDPLIIASSFNNFVFMC